MLVELEKELRKHIDQEKAAFFPRFFKSGPGEYGEGDLFLGITVPDQRKVAMKFKNLDLKDIEKLLDSKWHEERLTALLIMVLQFKSADTQKQKQLFEFYLSKTDRINNWDLVDTSARDIVGAYLFKNQQKLGILNKLVKSKSLWERRIAIISTFYFLNKGEPDLTIKISTKLLKDKHDLIHKAVGWMLREMGKRCDEKLLTDFLDEHASEMPRTMLRYAIERLAESKRQQYLRA